MGGLKPNSLKKFVESGMKILSCVDNDEAGRKFTEDNKFIPCRKILEENNVKDYNELLQKFSEIRKKAQQKSEKNEKKFSHSRR